MKKMIFACAFIFAILFSLFGCAKKEEDINLDDLNFDGIEVLHAPDLDEDVTIITEESSTDFESTESEEIKPKSWQELVEEEDPILSVWEENFIKGNSGHTVGEFFDELEERGISCVFGLDNLVGSKESSDFSVYKKDFYVYGENSSYLDGISYITFGYYNDTDSRKSLSDCEIYNMFSCRVLDSEDFSGLSSVSYLDSIDAIEDYFSSWEKAEDEDSSEVDVEFWCSDSFNYITDSSTYPYVGRIYPVLKFVKFSFSKSTQKLSSIDIRVQAQNFTELPDGDVLLGSYSELNEEDFDSYNYEHEYDYALIRDEVTFGDRKWLILTQEDDKVLLLSKYSLPSEISENLLDYDIECSEVTADNMLWKNTDTRAYLNGKFLSDTFTDQEIEAIIDTDTEIDCQDKVFLLSLEEFQLYFNCGGVRDLETYLEDRSGDYSWVDWCGDFDSIGITNNLGRFGRLESQTWILRNLYKKEVSGWTYYYCYQAGVKDGRIVYCRSGKEDECGIRPAMWVSKDALNLD